MLTPVAIQRFPLIESGNMPAENSLNPPPAPPFESKLPLESPETHIETVTLGELNLSDVSMYSESSSKLYALPASP